MAFLRVGILAAGISLVPVSSLAHDDDPEHVCFNVANGNLADLVNQLREMQLNACFPLRTRPQSAPTAEQFIDAWMAHQKEMIETIAGADQSLTPADAERASQVLRPLADHIWADNLMGYFNATGATSVSVATFLTSSENYVRSKAAEAASQNGAESGRGAELLAYNETLWLPLDLQADYLHLRGRSVSGLDYTFCTRTSPLARKVTRALAPTVDPLEDLSSEVAWADLPASVQVVLADKGMKPGVDDTDPITTLTFYTVPSTQGGTDVTAYAGRRRVLHPGGIARISEQLVGLNLDAEVIIDTGRTRLVQ
jgi:hypothetical protein